MIINKNNPYSHTNMTIGIIKSAIYQLHSLSDCNCDSYGGANHRVVAHTHKAHHLDVCRN